MNSLKFQQLHERLSAMQRRLLDELALVDEERADQIRPPAELSDVPTHNADRDAEDLDSQLAVTTSLRDELEAVDQALDRIHAGTYGKCSRCGHQISVERLEALPFATLCVRCQQAAEEEAPSGAP
jgi:DnaK suppressor protein